MATLGSISYDDWRNLPARDLEDGTVHVWTVQIRTSETVAEQFKTFLASDERARAECFRLNQIRRSFILARGILRILLGRYLSIEPSTIQFRYGPRGKPSMAAPGPLRFNVSHSGDLAVFAFMLDSEIGVDLEEIRPLRDLQEIAERFFCIEESKELISLPVDQRDHAFYLCWTRKEAYIKALGTGLSTPLDSFRVTLRPGAPARIIQLPGNIYAPERWVLHDLQLDSQYAAAVAYRDRTHSLRLLSVADPESFLSAP